MRRIFILLLMAALLAACVTGCNEKPEGNITTPATKAEATDPPVGTPEPEEETGIYAQILSDYRALVQFRLSDDFESRWNNGDHIDLSDTLDNTVKNTDGHWSNMVVEMTNGLNAPTMASYGYALRDINGDSVPELFWVREYQDILAVFTVHDGNVLLLDAFWSKYRCTLTDDNTLCARSSGDVYSVYSVQILTKEGTLECLKQFGINGDTYYEIIGGETVTIDAQRFDQLQTEYPFEDADPWLQPTMLGIPNPDLWYKNIAFGSNYSDRWTVPVVEKDDAFYYKGTDGMYRHDKTSGEDKRLVEADIHGLALYGDSIYYSTGEQICQLIDDSGSTTLIWDQSFLPEEFSFINEVGDFRFHAGSLYIKNSGINALRYIPETGETKHFLDSYHHVQADFSSFALIADTCYYIDHVYKTFSIYRMDIDTLEPELIRGDGICVRYESYPEKVYYDSVVSYHDQLYYFTRFTGDLFKYNGDAPDEMILDVSALDASLGLLHCPFYENLCYYIVSNGICRLYEYDAQGNHKLLLTIDAELCKESTFVVTDTMVFWCETEDMPVQAAHKGSIIKSNPS